MKKILVSALIVATSGIVAAAVLQDPEPPRALHPLVGRLPALTFWGDGQLSGGSATIDLPEECIASIKRPGMGIALTCRGGWSPLYVADVAEGRVTVRTTAQGNPGQSFSWVVIASATRSPGELQVDAQR